MEHARGPRRDGRGGRDGGDRRRAMWVDKYGPPTRTKYRMIVENLSTKMSWQVGNTFELNIETYTRVSFSLDFQSTEHFLTHLDHLKIQTKLNKQVIMNLRTNTYFYGNVSKLFCVDILCSQKNSLFIIYFKDFYTYIIYIIGNEW